MEKRRLPLNALRAFEAVAHSGSFTSGAAWLSVTQSAVSRHVTRLEQIIGQKLFIRDAKGATLTPAGKTLLPVTTRAFDDIARTLELLGAERVLRVHIPPGFLQVLALPIIHDFRRAHPELSLTIVSTNGTGLPQEEVDVSITFDLRDRGHLADANLLWPLEVTPACSADVARAANGKTLGEIAKGDNLLHVRLDNQAPTSMWSDFAERIGVGPITGNGLVFETTALAIEFARSGGGFALADLRMFAADIRGGQLATPFDAKVDTGYGYYLALSSSARSDPGAVLLHDWLRDALNRVAN